MLFKSSMTRYVLAGGLAFALELAVLFAFYRIIGLPALLATGLAFWMGFMGAFLLQKVFAFRDYQKSVKAISRQLSVYVLLVAFNYLFTLFLVGIIDDKYLFIVRTIALAITTTWNYFLYRFVIFNPGFSFEKTWDSYSKKVTRLSRSTSESLRIQNALIVGGVLLLSAVSVYSAIQTSRITVNSSDALVHTHLVGDGIKNAGIRLQPEHTNLLKFPLFYLQAKLGYSYESFVALNVFLTLATTLGWAYLVIRIFGKRFALLTLLSMSSVVLGSAVLNLNMNWTTIRNIEFPLALLFVLVAARYLQKNKPDQRSLLLLIGSTLLYGLLLASDAYFQYTISLAIIVYVVVAYTQSRIFTSNMLHVLVAVASASIIGKVILWMAEKARYLEIISSGDFGLKIIPLEKLFPELLTALQYLLSVVGGNIFGATIKLTNITIYVNFLILSFALLAIVAVIRNANYEFYSLRKRIEVTRVEPTVTILAISFALSFLLYVLSGQVGGGNEATHRYIVLSAFLIIPLFIWFISHYYEDHRTFKLFVALLLMVSIGFGSRIASRTYSLYEGYELPKKQAYMKASSLLNEEGVDVFISGHWYGSTTRFWSEKELTFATVDGCNGRFIALNRDNWYKLDPKVNKSALLIERKGYDHPFWAQCSDTQLAEIYGQPEKIIPVNEDDFIWIYDYDVRGKITR